MLKVLLVHSNNMSLLFVCKYKNFAIYNRLSNLFTRNLIVYMTNDIKSTSSFQHVVQVYPMNMFKT